MTLEKRPDGSPQMIQVDFPGRQVQARIWRVQVGRVQLLLLDTNVVENTVADREITYQLYGGDSEIRLKQELLLGIGGVRALAALGIEPSVFHINEGHSAFLTLERIAQLKEKLGLSWQEAREAVHASTVFTTHTPVPAGNDRFSVGSSRSISDRCVTGSGCRRTSFWRSVASIPHNHGEEFCMTVLALKMSHRANAVSSLHGTRLPRAMWQPLYPARREDVCRLATSPTASTSRTWLAAADAPGLRPAPSAATWPGAEHDADIWRSHRERRPRRALGERIRR